MRAAVLLALGLVPVLAGCTAGPEEARGCREIPYVSIHYDGLLPRETLRDAFEGRGWTWDPVDDGSIVVVEPPVRLGPVRGIVAPAPGPSGEGTVLSFEAGSTATLREQARVAEVARLAAGLANATAPDVPLGAWIEGTHDRCDGVART